MKVVWVTNIPTPYRQALWHAFQQLCDFRIVTMALSEPGRTWDGLAILSAVGGECVDAPCIPLSANLRIYLPNSRLLSIARGVDSRTTIVIDGWESMSYVVAAAIGRLRGATVLFYYRGTKDSRRRGGVVPWIRRLVFSLGDGVISGGPASSKALLSDGLSKNKVIEGLNVVDVERYSRRTSTPTTELGKAGHRFVYVGQLIERKNLKTLLEAFSEQNRADSLTLIGDGVMRESLEMAAVTMGISDRLSFTGPLEQDALIDVLQRSNTLVLCSLNEVYGLVVAEALAAGLHTVVSKNCGVADSIHGMKGVYLTDISRDSLSDGMRRSSAAWTGYLPSPEILQWTPRLFASRLLEAMHGLSVSRSKA